MESIETLKLYDTLWMEYFKFYKMLLKEFYPDLVMVSDTWGGFKERKVQHIMDLSDIKYREFIIFNEGSIVGYFDRIKTPMNIIFHYDSVYIDIPGQFYKIVFREVLNFMDENYKNECFFWSYDERSLKQILKIFPEKVEDYEITSLSKDEINIGLIKQIVEKFETQLDYRIGFFENIPLELLDKCAEMLSPIYEELFSANPEQIDKHVNVTNEDVKQMYLFNEKNPYAINFFWLRIVFIYHQTIKQPPLYVL